MTGAIALNTFREAVRDRILYLLLFFAVVLLVSSRVVALMTVGSEAKIVKDLGLAAIELFGVLIAVLMGVGLVFKEIEKRTVHVLLARPIRRSEFLLGKFAGLAALVTVNTLLLTVCLHLVLLARAEADLSLLPAIGLLWVEQLFMTAVALVFSSFSSPILSTVFTLSVWVTGHLSWSLRLLEQRMTTASGRWLCEILYWALPNLEWLNLKAEAVHGIPVPVSTILLSVVYGLAWTAGLAALACAIFSRRDFS